MAKSKEIETDDHPFYFEEGTFHLANLALAMINYVQYEYPPSYKAAVDAQFPDLFEKTNMLSEFMKGATFNSAVFFTDEDLYTLYTCYDLMGKLYVSDLYDEVMSGLHQESASPHPPELMKKIYQHTLTNIQPYLLATEMYAKKTKTLPMLDLIKKRLERLPLLSS